MGARPTGTTNASPELYTERSIMNVSRSQLEKGPVRMEVDGLPAIVMTLSDYEDLLDSRDPQVRQEIKEAHQEYLEGKARPLSELLDELQNQ
jgi:hypothetical protein